MKRPILMGFRINQAEALALDALATVEQRSKSETIREALRRTAIAAGVWPGQAPGEAQRRKENDM